MAWRWPWYTPKKAGETTLPKPWNSKVIMFCSFDDESGGGMLLPIYDPLYIPRVGDVLDMTQVGRVPLEVRDPDDLTVHMPKGWCAPYNDARVLKVSFGYSLVPYPDYDGGLVQERLTIHVWLRQDDLEPLEEYLLK